jgi:hypothetical protein
MSKNKNGGGFKRKGADGMKGKQGDGVCYSFRDTDKCRFGPNCKFKHVEGTKVKRIKMSKAEKKGITVAAIKSIKSQMQKKAKERDGRDLDDNDLGAYLSSLMHIRTYGDTIHVQVSNMATSALLNMSEHACWDSGAGSGITTDSNDLAWLDESQEAKGSVIIRGPSVGAPECGGRGPLVYRTIVEGVPHGLVHPDGVLAKSSVQFRVASERIMGKRGIRFVGGEFNKGDKLE